jgi:hypothetical protein
VSPVIEYVAQDFRASTLAIINQARTICEDYAAQGYELTLRQLYYQFVARGLLANSDKSYKRLGSIINDARLAGLLDWDHINDRTRYLRTSSTWLNPSEIIEASSDQFARNWWMVSRQQYRPEVWVEKDALVDVVARACQPWQVPHFSCRGYVSQSEMWRAGVWMLRHRKNGLIPVVIHLGDHDPSGIDMSRDIADRLRLFADGAVEVVRVALTMDQVEQYAPPPNPAKLTDSRGSDYVARYGYQSWELDALEPQVLVDLISEQIRLRITDESAWEQVQDEDADTRSRMRDVADRWDDLYERWTDVEEALDA